MSDNRYEQVIDLVKQCPNDQELGKKVRGFYFEQIQSATTEYPLTRYSKAEVQEQHFFYLTSWIESKWSDEIAKERMEELMAVMLTWKHFREDS
jgi:hypothetical protein